MPEVLLANELGSGLGHLNRLIAVARGLAPDCRLTFAVPDPQSARPKLDQAFGARARAIQGPAWPPPRGENAREVVTQTFADVMALFGFADPAVVRRNADLWRSQLATVRADLVIADFAPSTRTAKDDSVPLVVVGNGFTVPPPGQPFPPMRPWETAVSERSRQNEKAVFGALAAVRTSLSLPPVDTVADVFSGPQTFVCSIAAFDPYAPYRKAPLHQPFNVPMVPLGPERGDRTGPAIFVYMPADHPTLSSLLDALNAIEVPTHLYVTGQAPEVTAAKCKSHIGVLRHAADLAQVLPSARLVIHHAGLGTAYAALMSGTPQFLLPRNLEHLITARGLITLGVGQGYSANTRPSAAELQRGILMQLQEPGWGNKARQEGRHLHAGLRKDPLQPVLEACNAALHRSSPPPFAS